MLMPRPSGSAIGSRATTMSSSNTASRCSSISALRFSRAGDCCDALAGRSRLPAVIDLDAGMRSLQVHLFDRRRTSAAAFDYIAVAARRGRGRSWRRSMSILYRPPAVSCICCCSWDDPGHRELAIERYMQSVRADAPWCPSNIEFDSPHQRPRQRSMEVRRIALLARATGDGPGRCLPRRTGRHAARSAPSAGHPPNTIPRAPGRPKTRSASAEPTCASTAWRDRAAISSSAAPCRCGTAIGRPRNFAMASAGCCASSISCASIRCRAERAVRRLRADFPYGKASLRIEPTTLRLRDYRQFLRAERSLHRLPHSSPGQQARVRRRARAAQQAPSTATRGRRRRAGRWTAPRLTRQENQHVCRAGCIAISSPVSGSSGSIGIPQPGARTEAGAPACRS